MSNIDEMNTQPFLPKFRQKRENSHPLTPVREIQRPLAEPDSPMPMQRSHSWLRLLEAIVILLFLVISVVLATVGSLILYQVDWIAPGVIVSDIDVGQRTEVDAAIVLQAAWQNKAIQLEVGENRIVLTPAELGLVLDAQTTAVLAREQGRTWASWLGFVENGRFTISPIWQYDQEQAVAGLEAIAINFAKSPVEAQLVWQNGRFEALPGQPGQELDVVATEVVLGQQADWVLANGRLKPIVRVIQPNVVDLSAVAAEANTLLAAPLTVQAYDPVTDETISQTISPAVWGTWLQVDHIENQFEWSLDEIALAQYRDAWTLGEGRFVDGEEWQTAVTQAISSRNPHVALRVYHEPKTHIVASGETLASIGRHYGIPYPWLQQVNSGLDTLSAGQSIVIPSPDEMIPLPIVPHKRIIVSISQQKAWVYEHGGLKWEWPVSTGIASSPTSPGIFQIQSHDPNAYAGNWNLWMPSFMGIYRPVPASDFMNGFHGFPTRGGNTLLWTNDLGHPVTYGCVLLSSENAELLYNWAESGVIVEIRS